MHTCVEGPRERDGIGDSAGGPPHHLHVGTRSGQHGYVLACALRQFFRGALVRYEAARFHQLCVREDEFVRVLRVQYEA